MDTTQHAAPHDPASALAGPVVARAFWLRAPHAGEIRPVALPEPGPAVTVGPDGVRAARAVLAGTVEPAVNALWDAPPLIGDRVTVVGAGMVGCCVARLLRRFPGTDVTLVDVDPGRAQVAEALDV